MTLLAFLQRLSNPEDLSVDIQGNYGEHVYNGSLDGFPLFKAVGYLSREIESITIEGNLVSIMLEEW